MACWSSDHMRIWIGLMVGRRKLYCLVHFQNVPSFCKNSMYVYLRCLWCITCIVHETGVCMQLQWTCLLRLPPAGARKHRGVIKDIHQLPCGLWGNIIETYCIVQLMHRKHTRVCAHATRPFACMRPSTPLVQSSKEARKGQAQKPGNGGEKGSGESTKIIFVRKTP